MVGAQWPVCSMRKVTISLLLELIVYGFEEPENSGQFGSFLFETAGGGSAQVLIANPTGLPQKLNRGTWLGVPLKRIWLIQGHSAS